MEILGRKADFENVPIFLYQFKLVQKNWYKKGNGFSAVIKAIKFPIEFIRKGIRQSCTIV